MSAWRWNDEVARELTVLFQGWTDRVSQADAVGLDPYLHPDFLYVTVFGLRLDKAAYLDMVAGMEPGGSFTITRTSARVHEGADIAELDGEYDISGGTASGVDLSARTRFTATWVREDETWRCLTHHGTKYTGTEYESGQP